jgi:hypothetical protein
LIVVPRRSQSGRAAGEHMFIPCRAVAALPLQHLPLPRQQRQQPLRRQQPQRRQQQQRQRHRHLDRGLHRRQGRVLRRRRVLEATYSRVDRRLSDAFGAPGGRALPAALDSEVINSIDHIFASTAVGVFRSMNDADQWSDVGGGLLPPGGNVWAVVTEGIGSGEFAYAGTAGGGVFRSVQSIAVVRVFPRPRPRPTPAPRP